MVKTKDKIIAKKVTKNPVYYESSKDLPATFGQLEAVKAELYSHVTSVKLELKADVADVRSDIAEVKTDVAKVKADVAEVKADVAEVKNKIDKVLSILELQHARNLAVFDQNQFLVDRGDKHELQIAELQKKVHGISDVDI